MKLLRSAHANAVVWGVVYSCAAWLALWFRIEPYGLFSPAIVAEGAAYIFKETQSYRPFRWFFAFRVFTALCIHVLDFYLWRQHVDFVDPESKLVFALGTLFFIVEAAAIEAVYFAVASRRRPVRPQASPTKDRVRSDGTASAKQLHIDDDSARTMNSPVYPPRSE
jgi:hypothetical protein